MGRRRRRRADQDVFGLLVALAILVAFVPGIRDFVIGTAVPTGLILATIVGSYVLFRDARKAPHPTGPALPTTASAHEDEAAIDRGREVRQTSLIGRQPSIPVKASPSLPYRARPMFFNRSELVFYDALRSAIADRYAIFSKVRLLDICGDLPWHELTAFNKISQKHVDFLLCDPATFRLTAAIELDGSSHWRRDRQESDEFKDELFREIRIPLIRFPVRVEFDPPEIARRIDEAVASSGA